MSHQIPDLISLFEELGMKPGSLHSFSMLKDSILGKTGMRLLLSMIHQQNLPIKYFTKLYQHKLNCFLAKILENSPAYLH